MGKKSKSSSDLTVMSSQDSKFAEDLIKGRKDELLFAGWVNLAKGKSSDNRLLVIGKVRATLVTSKLRIDKDGNLADLKAIESTKETSVTLVYDSWNATLSTPQANEVINALVGAHAAVFPNIPPEKALKITVEPSSRVRETTGDSVTACGGFNDTYRVLADLAPNCPIREDIVWDVANLFTTNNVTDFNFEDFEQPITPEQLVPLLAALRYNSYFSGFIVKHITLDKKTFPEIGKLLNTNTSITKLVLSNCGMNRDGCITIFDGLRGNPNSEINVIDISRNSGIDDKGMTAFANALAAMKTGLVQLDASRCGVNKTGMTQLAQALRKNLNMTGTLDKLDLSNNTLDAEGSSALSSWLANPNKLHHLNLSNATANLETIVPALIRGCNEIRELNFSGNKLGKRATQSLCQFLQASDSLQSLNLDNTSLTVDEMVLIVQAIGENPYLQDFQLSIAGNKLGLLGAKQISALGASAPNIVSINVADNDFTDEGLSVVCQALSNSMSLKSIDLSRNYSPKPGKGRGQMIEDLISLINSECPLENLRLRGSKNSCLKTDLLSFIDGVGTNDTLLYLDISSQQIGNKGAMALGKMLQTNRKLKNLIWEDNGTTLFGFSAVATGLERNRYLKEMPIPIIDITNSMTKQSEDPIRLQKCLARIQSTLARNQNPKSLKGGGGGGGFAQLSIFSSGEREQLERLKYKVKSTNREVPADQKIILEDADNNDSSMAALHGIVEAHQLAMSDEITKKLKELAGDIMPVFETHFRNMLTSVLESVGERYKSLDSDTIRRMNTNISFGVQPLEAKSVETILADAASAEISSKANDVFTSALEIATTYIYEKLQDGLVTIIDEVKTAPQKQQAPRDESPSIREPEPEPEPTPATPSTPEPKKSPAPPPRRGGPPPNRPSPGVPRGGFRGRGLPAGLDPTKMVPGAGRGFQLPPVGARSPVAPVSMPPSTSEPESSSPSEKKRTGFGAKKSPAPKPAAKKPSASVKPVPKMPKPKKPSGDTQNIKAIDAAVKESDSTTPLTHVTRDRPMVRGNRRPPTRRPRVT